MAAIAIWNKRYTRARTCEGQKIARLNSVNLEDVEYFTVVDPFKKLPEQQNIARIDYLEDVDITVTADPRMASQPQRFSEAMQAIQVTMQIPMAAANPALMAALLKLLYVAMDRPELVAAMESMPMMPMMPGAPSGPGGGGAPPDEPPDEGKAPRPKPKPPGQAVPNAGPQPANGQGAS